MLNATLPEYIMMLNHCFKVRSFILTAALITGLCLVNHASAQELEDRSYLINLNSKAVTQLGTLFEGGYTSASGINDTGQVVGSSSPRSYVPGHAFITGPDGVGMTDLGTLGGVHSAATGINDAGQVAGFSHTIAGSDYRGFITGPDGMGMRALGTLGGES